jgi:hypothetical protein
MILVVHFALICALARLFRSGIYGGLILTLALSPTLLALLVLVFDRPSPAKYWLAGLLASLFLPSLAISFDLLAAAAGGYIWRNRGSLLILDVVNVLGVVALFRVAWRLPRRCPECGLRAWLPLGRRSTPLFWCASCGFREKAAGPKAVS